MASVGMIFLDTGRLARLRNDWWFISTNTMLLWMKLDNCCAKIVELPFHSSQSHSVALLLFQGNLNPGGMFGVVLIHHARRWMFARLMMSRILRESWILSAAKSRVYTLVVCEVCNQGIFSFAYCVRTDTGWRLQLWLDDDSCYHPKIIMQITAEGIGTRLDEFHLEYGSKRGTYEDETRIERCWAIKGFGIAQGEKVVEVGW